MNEYNLSLTINKQGHILSSNMEFSKRFHFNHITNEISYHYIIDLFRYENDYKKYMDMIEKEVSNVSMCLLRTRSRRLLRLELYSEPMGDNTYKILGKVL